MEYSFLVCITLHFFVPYFLVLNAVLAERFPLRDINQKWIRRKHGCACPLTRRREHVPPFAPSRRWVLNVKLTLKALRQVEPGGSNLCIQTWDWILQSTYNIYNHDTKYLVIDLMTKNVFLVAIPSDICGVDIYSLYRSSEFKLTSFAVWSSCEYVLYPQKTWNVVPNLVWATNSGQQLLSDCELNWLRRSTVSLVTFLLSFKQSWLSPNWTYHYFQIATFIKIVRYLIEH